MRVPSKSRALPSHSPDRPKTDSRQALDGSESALRRGAVAIACDSRGAGLVVAWVGRILVKNHLEKIGPY